MEGPVDLWRDHLKRIYPNDADFIEKWLAFHIQYPGEKVNFALVLAGPRHWAEAESRQAGLEIPVELTLPWTTTPLPHGCDGSNSRGWLDTHAGRGSHARLGTHVSDGSHS